MNNTTENLLLFCCMLKHKRSPLAWIGGENATSINYCEEPDRSECVPLHEEDALGRGAAEVAISVERVLADADAKAVACFGHALRLRRPAWHQQPIQREPVACSAHVGVQSDQVVPVYVRRLARHRHQNVCRVAQRKKVPLCVTDREKHRVPSRLTSTELARQWSVVHRVGLCSIEWKIKVTMNITGFNELN